MSTRSGFVALAGRPNVGKSTLVNAMVGHKVAIVSDKPQTTRRAIRGVATGPDWQLVLVDLPGVQRPRDALTTRMQSRVERELADSDAALMIVNGLEGVGPGDRFIADALRKTSTPVIVAVNKVDKLSDAKLMEVLQAAGDLEVGDDIYPISARKGTGLEPLLDRLRELLPEGPFYYDPAEESDQTEATLLAELIREQVLRRTFQEVPHAVEVVIDDDRRGPRGPDPRDRVHWVETNSQKGILIGAQGKMIKAIGTAARRELQRELGMQGAPRPVGPGAQGLARG